MKDIVEQLRNFDILTEDGYDIRHFAANEIETLRERVAELDIDVAAWTNTAHILDSRAEKAKARIAELEKKLEGMADLAQGEFSRAEKAEAALSEALTIRTVEDVRREAFNQCADALNAWGYHNQAREIRALIDTPAPSRETQLCPDCGISDDGIGCGCDYGLQTQPTPSPEPVAWGESYDGGAFFNTVSLTKTRYHTFPLYTTPRPDELRKAKAEAWEAGFEAGESPVGRGHFKNPYAAPEGGK